MFSPRLHKAAFITVLAVLPTLVAGPASGYEPDSAPARPAVADSTTQDPTTPLADPSGLAPSAAADEDGEIEPATDAEKIQAATIVGLDTSQPSNPIGLNDRDFTFELWMLATAGTEVRGTALLSLSDWDPDAQICVSCTLYIRQGIKEAQQRDTTNEIRDRQTAQAAESRRQQAADMVEIAVTPRLIGSGDRDFIISVWDYLTKEKPRFTATIAAAQTAFTGDAAKAEAFLTGGLATAFAADQRRIIEEDTAGDLAAKAEAERRFARKYAANVVGISVRVDDAAWMTTEDPIFLRDVYRKIQGNQFWTLTYQGLANEVLNGTDETARAMINTGLFDLVERDRVRRNQEIMKVYKDYVTVVRDNAVGGGYKNVARAATAALATNSIAKLVDFIQKRDTLPADSSELTQLHKVGTSVQLRTRSEIGRWTSKDRLLWKSAAGAWNFANSRVVSGDFDGDSKRDAFLLHWGPTSVNGWFLTNIDGTVRAPVSAWASAADSAGKNYELKNMAIGDFNGDGRSELAIFAKNKAAKPVILHLSKPVTGNWTSKEYASTDVLIGGRHVAGDVNNDKKEDIITIQQDATKGMQMWVGLSTATALGTAVAKWSDKNFAVSAVNNPVAADLDRNGFAELVLLRQESGSTKSNNGASLHVFSNLNGTVTRLEKWRTPGGMSATKTKVFAEDVNGDDYLDMVVHYTVHDEMTHTYSLLNSGGGGVLGPAGLQRLRLVAEDSLKIAELKFAES